MLELEDLCLNIDLDEKYRQARMNINYRVMELMKMACNMRWYKGEEMTKCVRQLEENERMSTETEHMKKAILEEENRIDKRRIELNQVKDGRIRKAMEKKLERGKSKLVDMVKTTP